MTLFHRQNLSRSTLLAACSVVALGASAQGAAAAAADAASTTTALEEVIVTAQKRSENLQDVPASITALTSDALEARQINSLADLRALVPSFQVGYNYGSNLITLRGVSTNLTAGADDPSVAMHIDGVYQPRSRNLDVAMIDLQRVEVLSGPQGTLYGRNATGGVVNYILNQPTKEFEAKVTGVAGNYNRFGVEGMISGPLTDKLSYRLVGIWDDQSKGFTKDLTAGAPRSSIESKRVAGVRGALRFQPTDAVRFDLDAFYVDTKSPQNPGVLAPSGNAFLRTVLTPQTYEPHKTYAGSDTYGNSEDLQASLTGSWSINDNLELKSITGYQTLINSINQDYDATAFRGQDTNQDTKSQTFTQEFNLTGRSFDGRLTSIFGFFYLDDHVKTAAFAFIKSSPAAAFQGLFLSDQDAKSYSFFTDQTFAVTDKLRLIAGVRYNNDKKTMTNRIVVGGATTCAGLSQTLKWDAWTPRFGAQYDVAPGIMAYVTWQKGFKSGGFQANTCLDSYDPESIKGVEAGIKSEFWDRRARLNVAAYRYTYSNLQVQKQVGIAGFSVVNAADSRLKGIEATFELSVTDRLQLSAAGMVQSAKYLDFLNCNATLSSVACTAADPRSATERQEQLKGNWLNRAPPYSMNMAIQYTFDVARGELVLRGDSVWVGKTRYNEFNTPILTQNEYSVQNAYATYTPEKSNLTFRAFIKNLANKDYRVHANYGSSQQTYNVFWAPPRTYGAEISARF